MVMASRSNGGFVEGEEGIFTEGEYNHKDRTAKVDVDNTVDHDVDQKPSTPRSKHSATEQRRRTKINDRFRTLRDLIPPSDLKRDKASLLLEVINHVRLLQDKVQKYESSPYPARSQDGSKLTPWRACPGAAAAPPLLLPGGDGSGAAEPETSGVHEHLIPDEGSSDLSSSYSQSLLERLTVALEGAGVDLTKASLSVQVKLARQTEEAPTDAPFSGRAEKRAKPEAARCT